MAPFFILVISLIVLRVLGRLGVKQLSSWRDSGRGALAIMFLFTGATHFTEMKHDYLAMLPHPVPKSLWLIYLTGLLEIAGAVGLLIPRFQRSAAVCLAVFLVLVFAGNVNAALNDIPFRGRPSTPLWLRTPIQVIFIMVLWWTSIRKRSSSPRTT